MPAVLPGEGRVAPVFATGGGGDLQMVGGMSTGMGERASH